MIPGEYLLDGPAIELNAMLGMEAAKWLAQQGARHLVLAGRNAPSGAVIVQLNGLRAQNVVRTPRRKEPSSVRVKLVGAAAEAPRSETIFVPSIRPGVSPSSSIF